MNPSFYGAQKHQPCLTDSGDLGGGEADEGKKT